MKGVKVEDLAAVLTAGATILLAILTWLTIRHELRRDQRQSAREEEARTPILAIQPNHASPPKNDNDTPSRLRVHVFNFGQAPLRILQGAIETSGGEKFVGVGSTFVPVMGADGKGTAVEVQPVGWQRSAGEFVLTLAFQYGLTGNRIHQAKIKVVVVEPIKVSSMFPAWTKEHDVTLKMDAGLLSS